MKEFLDKALNCCQVLGAHYADIRIIDTKREHLTVVNGEASDTSLSTSLGFGIRVLVDGAWGFSGSSILNFEEIERVAKLAYEIGKASSQIKERDVQLAAEPIYQDFWQTPYILNPFDIPMSDKFTLLFEIDKGLGKDKRIKDRKAGMLFVREHKWFASSVGSVIEQDLMLSGGGFSCTAVDQGERQRRSYPSNFGGQYRSMGYECILCLDMLNHVDRVREEAIALLSAPECPSGKKDLILLGNQLLLQIHESVGHPTELDRVLGWESNFAGSSFATTEKLNHFQYASPIVNLVADGTVPTGVATQGYDDDGVRQKRWHIVKDGILNGYMTTRETAHYLDQSISMGCNRSQGFNDVPITRICNLSLMPGTISYEDLIASTDDGLLFDLNKSWSIDQRRLNFEFGCELAREIKNGKLGKLYKNPVYHGITPEFWNSCDAIADHNSWDLWGVINCGKGQPGQVNRMSHGCSPARFKNVSIN